MPKVQQIRRGALALVTVALLASCHGGKPTGQVVARVGSEEITVAELRLEASQMAGGGDPNAVQQQALQTLITRKLLVREAGKRNLDTSPQGKALIARAREGALVDLFNAETVSKQPFDSSDSTVNKFIVDHPSQFSDRKLITADQLVVSSADPALGGKLQGMGSLEAVENYLTQNNIAFVRSAGVVDTAQLPPEAATKIAALQTNALYAAPGAPVRIMRVLSSQSAPLTGGDARNAALRLMGATRTRAAAAEIQQIISKGKSKVWIDPTFAAS